MDRFKKYDKNRVSYDWKSGLLIYDTTKGPMDPPSAEPILSVDDINQIVEAAFYEFPEGWTTQDIVEKIKRK